ncbi:E3 ubiquitin-protein ligase ORTHRUS 2 [Raphanus sativus]|uniref:RING-type E3 ubiquitin transferase n=1 Tax=Raphanus sativus TaxID=3726 RepID=A0A6J0K2Y9_RAPSA|nr:E3 ubiquitin-protein ligase ORTHRUS 2 [Raphanus sativus]
MNREDVQLPCDADDVCMRCKAKIPSEECLTCGTCVTPWHVACLRSPPSTLASTQSWECPDCSGDVVDPAPVSGLNPGGLSLVAKVRAIEADASLNEAQKAKKRQQLVSGGKAVEEEEEKKEEESSSDDFLVSLRKNVSCSICLHLPERPVTTPCGHNFCLKCFQKWVVGKRKPTCVTCRASIPKKVADNPRINSILVSAIRLAMVSKSTTVSNTKTYQFIRNMDRPEKAFTTERAKKTGKANACSGRIYVTVPSDHFGPILAENDPERNQGVLVGESWEDRQECRQWGAHFPHVAGIGGQSSHGAQSVALSGGYKDDEDHGEWFLYTGSGGRDLTGNKRTNKDQAFDQKFTKSNEALRISCKMGYPVRVVRSHKEKRSAYAPAEKSVRYDGVYRIEKCWRKVGVQGKRVCRYLFVRCDNEPAPWTSDEHGDRPRPLPSIPELKKATEMFVRKESPSWDFDEADGRWKWMKSPPASKKAIAALDPAERKRARKGAGNNRDKFLKEFGCQICREVMSSPVTTPCAHNFCKECLTGKFAGITQVRQRSRGGRTLRAQKNVMKCPCCPNDISDFLQNPQVNRELMDVIEEVKKKKELEEREDEVNSENSAEGGGNTGSEEEEEDQEEEEEEDEEEEEEDEEEVHVSEDEPAAKKIKLSA